jgi:hypothetical protein
MAEDVYCLSITNISPKDVETFSLKMAHVMNAPTAEET